jgi:hypothetical protein
MTIFGILKGSPQVLVVSMAIACLLPWARAEEVKLREQAVQMLERADAASTTPTRPNYENIINFRVHSAEANEPSEGEVRMIWAGPLQRRQETNFGKYHLLNIWYGDQLFVSGEKGSVTPPIVRRAMKFLPLRLVRFDQQDVIRSIEDAVVHGRPAQCIEFDTKFGETVNSNEICVDKELGTMLRFRDGAETEEYSEFFLFSGAYLPGQTEIYRNGALMIELHQKYSALPSELDMGLFAPPPGAEIRHKCQQTRQAFGVSMPQPTPGVGDQTTDMVLEGVIGPNGKVYSAVVMTPDHPELNAEALQLVSTWTYTPALCDGKPYWQKSEFALRFQGR